MSASESGHWYLRDSTPCHLVPKKTGGGMRGFDLRWDRHLKAVPSVTTALGVVNKEQLNVWRVKQGILAALTLPKIDGEPEEVYLKRVMDDSKQQVIDAANEGTRIHSACEDHFAGRRYPVQYEPHVKAVLVELKRIFPQVDDWISEKRFAHRSGFGGTCDLHSPSTGIVADYKGKDGDFTELGYDGKPKRLAYDQYWQLAAYQNGFELPRAEGAAIFVSRTHPGAVTSHTWSAEEMEQGWQVFQKSLALWKEIRQYDGSWS